MNKKSIVKTVIWQNIDTVADDMTPEDFIKSYGFTREEAIKLMTTGFFYRETDTEIQKFELRICSKDIFANETIRIKDIIELMVGKESKVVLFSLDDEILFTEEDNYTLDEIADFLAGKYPYDYEPFELDIKI